MKVSKGLEFHVVALVGVGHMPAEGKDEKDQARLFYVAATHRLVITASGDGGVKTQSHRSSINEYSFFQIKEKSRRLPVRKIK